MNLIKSSTDEDHLRRFFFEQLGPIALKLRKDGIRFFALSPNDKTKAVEEDSWYSDYPKDTPELVEVDTISLELELQKLWESQGLSQLDDLAEQLGDLSRQLKLSTPIDDADISPLIYVMF